MINLMIALILIAIPLIFVVSALVQFTSTAEEFEIEDIHDDE